MEWLLLGLVALGVLALSLLRSCQGSTDHAKPHPERKTPESEAFPAQDPLLRGEDQSELDHLFAAVDAEVADRLIELLELRLHDVIRRQVPVRVIRASPAPRVARICFSNGIIVLVKPHSSGGLVPMAKAMLRTSVTLDHYERPHEDRPPILRFVWRQGGQVEVIAVGLDQAD